MGEYDDVACIKERHLIVRMQACQVAILTHFATEIPFAATTEELLTQLFVDAGVTLHTSVVVEELEYVVGEKRVVGNKRLALVDHNGYKKECVESTAGFVGQNAEVVIALCHGSERGAHKTASLCFKCDNRGVASFADRVWAKRLWKDRKTKPVALTQNGAGEKAVTLHSVIKMAKLAILLTCNGDVLLQDYVYSEEREGMKHPDLLIYNGKDLCTYTLEIYMALFVNIMDSTMNFARNPSIVHPSFYNTIMRIFEIVKIFGDDHMSFWTFLQHLGCITDNADEKDRQELPYPRARLGDNSRFRVYGRVCAYAYKKTFPQTLLREFKRIQLISCLPPTDGVYENEVIDCTTVPDMIFKTSNNDKIYRFLKRYQESKGEGVAPAFSASSATPVTAHATGLHQFLQELRALSEY